MEYAVNKDDIHDEVDCVKKLFNFSEQKVSNAGKTYMECTTGMPQFVKDHLGYLQIN